MGRIKNLIGKFKFGKNKQTSAAFVHIKTTASLLNDDPAWASSGSGEYAYSDSDGGELALKASGWVYSCATKIATSMSDIPLKVYVKGVEAPATYPLVKLLDEPIPGMAQSQWLYLIALYLTLGGETYLEKVRVEAMGVSAVDGKKFLTKELWAFPGSYFTPVVKDDVRRQIPTGYTPNIGSKKVVKPDDIIHTRYSKPGNINAGFGSVEGSESEINTDAQASAWQQTAMGNRGVPDGVFKYTGDLGLGTEDEEDVDQMIADRWSGIKNAHRPFVLGKDMSWIDLSKTMVELEMIPGREFTRAAICAAMGVPSIIFDVSAATYANMAAAVQMLMTFTVKPRMALLIDSLNLMLAPEYGDDVEIRADVGASEAMLTTIRERWSIAVMAKATGAPMDQIFKAVGLDVEPYEGIDTPSNEITAEPMVE